MESGKIYLNGDIQVPDGITLGVKPGIQIKAVSENIDSEAG